ncbi:hypothetical protein [Pseudorhodoferax sp. Leaf267]|uniref:hypothetical protein n=1 Tax=Pseudorhodoferax sp. Leaf267 TaxID=1736316 RepID=UPI0006F78909|nr:hypothetical protein [Pseudorhodoferax sp. Leaf267]KQP13680.1 hypothetical protein ASF43_17435 [Pseudorhodoferax sp. Leaf267]
MKAAPSRKRSPRGAIALFCAGIAAGLLGAALPLVTDALPPEPSTANAHAKDPAADGNWLCDMTGMTCPR